MSAYSVSISGNEKTDLDVILTEIQDLRTSELSKELVVEVKRRLWNLRIFSQVDTEIKNGELVIAVAPRWTLIPIAKASSGGGSSFYTVGVYDINTAGQYIEAGAQYESLNNKPAGVLWSRKPHFLGDRNLKSGVDLWTINRVRNFYGLDGEDDGAYTLRRQKLALFLEKKMSEDFYLLGINFEYHQDDISDFGLSSEQEEENFNNSFSPDEESINKWLGVYFTAGRLDYENYLQKGKQLRLDAKLIFSSINGEDKALTDLTLKYNHYWLFENHNNLAWQFLISGTNSEQLQYQKYIGGLSEVRGYRDGQFFNQSYWQSNLEHRFDLIERNWLVLQGAVFSDMAKEGRTLQDIGDSKSPILLSSGVGVRFISPKIFRFVGRLDYAQTHTRFVDQSLSFGIQQFF